MGEVIKFPGNSSESETPSSVKEVQIAVNNVRLYHINETLESILPMLFGRLAMAGFDIAASDDIKNGALLVEALRSVLCKYYAIDHPFQDIAENVFKADDNGELELNKSLHVEFKKVAPE